MRTARQRSLRAPLALCLAVLIAWVQATGGFAWASCSSDDAFESGNESCCCTPHKQSGGCCSTSETTTRRNDRLVGTCGCSHRRVPGSTAPLSGPTVSQDDVVALPKPCAALASELPCLPWRHATRPAPDPPPPRTRA